MKNIRVEKYLVKGKEVARSLSTSEREKEHTQKKGLVWIVNCVERVSLSFSSTKMIHNFEQQKELQKKKNESHKIWLAENEIRNGCDWTWTSSTSVCFAFHSPFIHSFPFFISYLLLFLLSHTLYSFFFEWNKCYD